MNWRYLTKTTGVFLVFLGAAMIPALLWGLWYDDGSAVPLMESIAITCGAGVLFYLTSGRFTIENLSIRDGMAIVAAGWFTVGLFGSLPFYLGGVFDNFTDAFFESVSGVTTTGASVLTDIESVPAGLLFWRSLIQWLGGMGIIVLSLAILPFLGVGGMQLYKAEAPSPTPDKLQPRIKDTAAILWRVYMGITLVQIVLLMIGGLSLYDSMCHAFTTMPTGGFSTKNLSMAHFDSIYIDSVTTLFMFLAGINFALHYRMLTGRPLTFWRDAECRFYCVAVAMFAGIVTMNLYGTVYESLGESLRYGVFQVVSIITTTGFATADYEQWPSMSKLILLLCMFLGASAGSTGGGMKCLRIMLCFKYCYKELFSMIHPRAVTQIKIGGKVVHDDVIRSVLGFLALYMGLFALCSVLLAGLGVDFVTSFGAVAATIGNIGPGFGLVGPAENYASMPLLAKWLLIWCMLLGRLEIYTVIIFLVPAFWRK